MFDLLQFLGTVSPQLAPTLLIAYLSIRLILELLRERRQTEESFRQERAEWRETMKAEQKEWRDNYEKLASQVREEQARAGAGYIEMVTGTVEIGRDITNQMHSLRGDIQKAILELGKAQAHASRRAKDDGQ